MSLLVLPHTHTREYQAIWSEAVRRGWKTLRFDPDKTDPKELEGHGVIRYYGNVLHKTRIEKFLPIEFFPVSDTLLHDLDISWTGRKIKMIPFKHVDSPLKKDTFIKCVDVKWLEAKVYKEGDIITDKCQGMLPDDRVYVQEPFPFIDEVRCFVIGRKVVTASYYRKNKEFCPENLPIDYTTTYLNRTEFFMKSNTDFLTAKYLGCNFPNGVVLDYGLGEMDNRWVLIEANEAWASGRYDCDPEQMFNTIIESQKNI